MTTTRSGYRPKKRASAAFVGVSRFTWSAVTRTVPSIGLPSCVSDTSSVRGSSSVSVTSSGTACIEGRTAGSFPGASAST